jgi:hypothetical protein
MNHLSPARLEADTLVLANGHKLPQVCVKCGTTHGLATRTEKFAFVPTWARFFGPLIQRIFTKHSQFDLPICGACNSQWKKWNVIVGVSWLPGFLFTFLGPALFQSGAMALVGMLMLVGGLVTASILRRKHNLDVTKIDATHTWIVRVHPAAQTAAIGPETLPTGAAPRSSGISYAKAS